MPPINRADRAAQRQALGRYEMFTAQQGKETDAKESRCGVRLQEAGKGGPALMQCADRIRTKEDTMIKLPKEVARIMKTLTDAKQEAFAVGDCVRDALLGQKPIGWDIATDAGFDKLRGAFPGGEGAQRDVQYSPDGIH